MKTHLILIALAIVVPIHSKKSADKDKPKWAQKGKLRVLISGQVLTSGISRRYSGFHGRRYGTSP